MNILLLEDEEAIRGFIRINLRRNDMTVMEAGTGEEAIALAAEEGPFDIALLDVMLPTISGFEVLSVLRERYPRMGIIMLTAKSQEADKIHGLELGADDYVQKPFSPGELIARMQSLYRRMQPLKEAEAPARVPAPAAVREDSANEAHVLAEKPAPPMAGQPFRLAASERKLYKHGVEVILTPTEWALLKLLMERPNESVSRDDILSEVWGRYYVGDLKVVDVNIRRIRQKIEDDPSAPAYLETVWGFGYRWKREVPAR
ncbi:two component transcriptional regulator, winged helix family [Paenibacillus curdlanolyticus YK9]|uniref:Two component transcriptional regulator, winged helix family n=1 Tax=Paenibacillus curdlanolyticus YK9 TaxID=717606 RepID=E0IAG2_9BACL|nr:response regulator transcription factor [Paenibacillus curdlanolyticus]EFM10739.1 two component transcriptional regulator, winged helix family [Paenibacillus curdlanolyticus YK9]